MLRSKLKLEEGWATLLLLMFMLFSVVWSVLAADWTEGLEILPWVGLAALLLGVILAKWRRVPALLAHLLSLIAGLVCVILLIDVVFTSLAAPAGLVVPGAGFAARITGMCQQAIRWVLAPSDAQAWLSNFMFVVSAAVGTWVVCYASAWFVFRAHWAWGAIVPAGVGCVLNIYYAPPRLVVYFMAYCLSALLLAVQLHVYNRQVMWREAEVNYNLDVDLSFLRDGLVASLVALVLAWTVPAAARNPTVADFWSSFEEPWQEVQTLWTRLFTSLNYQGQTGLIRFGRTMTLGGGANLGNIVVLEVEADEPHYWQAVAYDRYTGSGWVNTDDGTLVVPSGESRLNPVPYAMQEVLTHTVRMRESGEQLLFYAGQPVESSRSAQASLSFVPVAGREPATDVSMLSSLRILGLNDSYDVTSLVSRATAGQLRGAGTDYPSWVSSRYLQLPLNLSQRVRELGQQLVGQAATPYDQAEEVRNYLRRIPYDRTIGPPPAGSDPIDWFLFENRRGFCDYYASAMVLMLRSAGVPARISQGYAAGQYDTGSQSYQVRQLDAHAWPEVYFPGYGWIEFEPTSSQPLITRRTEGDTPLLPGLDVIPGTTGTEEEDKYGPDESEAGDQDIADITLGGSRPWYQRHGRLILTLLVAMAAVLLGLVGWWYWSLRELGLAARAYEQMRRLGGLVGVPLQEHQTPFEYGESLVDALVQSQDDVRHLVGAYVKQRFSQVGLSVEEEQELAARWQRLRLVLWRRVLTPRLKRRPVQPPWVPSGALRPPTSMG
jgi:transglutaminase-like putative cysteine protease